MIAASVLETGWMAQARATGGPWMFVAEAVLAYLDAADARRAIVGLAEHFPGARIAFDTTATRMVESQHRHDAMRHLPRESWFRWCCDDPLEIESWGAGVRLLASKTFLDADRDLLERIPLPLRLGGALRTVSPAAADLPVPAESGAGRQRCAVGSGARRGNLTVR